jgi:hypothetical protein
MRFITRLPATSIVVLGADCAELLTSVDQDEGHLQIDAVLGNLAFLHDDLLFLDPRALDVLECFGCPSDALLNGILEALVRAGDNFRNSGYRHWPPPS